MNTFAYAAFPLSLAFLTFGGGCAIDDRQFERGHDGDVAIVTSDSSVDAPKLDAEPTELDAHPEATADSGGGGEARSSLDAEPMPGDGTHDAAPNSDAAPDAVASTDGGGGGDARGSLDAEPTPHDAIPEAAIEAAAKDAAGDAETHPFSSSCREIKAHNAGLPSGIYSITPLSGKTYDVYCDMDLDGGGWTTFFAGKNGSPNVFGHFELLAVSCTDPQKYCMRRLPATLDSTFEFAATCGGAAMKFKMPEPAVGYFRDGVQGPKWQQLSALTSIRAANLAYATILWTGDGMNYGWIISSGTLEQTFSSSYGYDQRWNYCNGTANVDAGISLMYR